MTSNARLLTSSTRRLTGTSLIEAISVHHHAPLTLNPPPETLNPET
jgi:hypothetical protein